MTRTGPFALLLLLLGCAGVPYAEDAWIEVRTPNFLLISNAPEDDVLQVAHRLEQFRAVATTLTGAERLDATLPTRVFVFGDSTSWSHFQPDSSTYGYYISDMEANYIAVDLSGGPDREGLQIALHEYVHFISRNQGSRVHQPTWYEEGFADAVSTARFEEKGIVVGAVPRNRAAWLLKGRWLPLERIVTARGYESLSSRERAMFYAQSWLLVHRLTWGHAAAGFEPRNQQQLAYIRRTGLGDDAASAFRESFGVSFEEMEQELRDYVKAGPPLVLVRGTAPDSRSSSGVLRRLPAGAQLVHLCELQLARGEAGAAEAEGLARRMLETSPDDPRAQVLLSLALLEQGEEPDPALAVRALALAPDDPAVVRGVAWLGLRRLQSGQLIEDHYLELAAETRDLYARAVELDPWVPAAHAGLGYTYLALNEPVEADRALREAFRLARWDLGLALTLGELHAEYGRPEEARRLLREVAGSAHEDAMRVRARELLDRIE